MSTAVAARRRAIEAFAVVLVCLVVAACGTAAPVVSPAATTAVVTRSFAPIANPAPATPKPSILPTTIPSIAASPMPSTVAALPRHGRIVESGAGYAVTLPTNWFRVDLNAEDIEQFAKAGAGSTSSGVTDQLAGQVAQLAAQRISLFALRFPDAKAKAGTNLNIAALPSLGLDLDTLEKLNLAQLGAVLGKSVTIGHTRVTLPSGEAVKFAYTLSSPAMAGGKAGLTQYLILGARTQYILTCTAPETIAKIAPECDKIARSLELLP